MHAAAKLLAITAASLAAPLAAPVSAQAQDWAEAEAPVMTNTVQLTSRDTFYKAGEQYFSPDGRWIIFQGIETPEPGSVTPSGIYAMYVAEVMYDDDGNIAGIGDPVRVSAPGSANTCGWFHPTNKGEIMFGSTLVPPGDPTAPGYEGPNRDRYKWDFPSEMEIVTASLTLLGAEHNSDPTPLFTRPAYDAEASYSPDGRFVLYAHVDEERGNRLGRPDADLYVYDTKNESHIPMVLQDGYDGGPFFSPDMRWICYRSDRLGNDNLQLFVAEIDWSADGDILGIKREVQITENVSVNWAPFFHPSNRFLVYTTSELGHFNYEVFAIEFDPDKPMEDLWKVRVTHAEGFDGLPVFSPDGKHMIWCAQRGKLGAGDERPSSQVWATRFDAEALLRKARGRGGF